MIHEPLQQPGETMLGARLMQVCAIQRCAARPLPLLHHICPFATATIPDKHNTSTCEPPLEQEHDQLLTYMDEAGEVVVRAVTLATAVSQVAQRQSLSPLATAAAGEALVCATLVAAGLKHDRETLQLVAQGDGPLGSVIAIADRHGLCRARVAHGDPSPPPPSLQHALGSGLLHVLRTHASGGKPYTASVPLPTSCRIADALVAYAHASEQREGLFAAACTLPPSPLTASHDAPQQQRAQQQHAQQQLRAQGYAVEFLPGASAETRAALLAAHAMLAPELQLRQVAAAVTAERLLSNRHPRLIATASPRFECTCSRERSAGAVAMLGRQELLSAAAEGRDLEVRCEFCGAAYAFEPQEITAMAEGQGGGGGSGT